MRRWHDEHRFRDNMSDYDPRFDIWKLYNKAKFEWLKPVEVLFILKNYDESLISPKPPNKPPGGTLFLFNRRVLRFFRNDGHAWRRKKAGQTIGEAHEKLKVDNVPVLSCYYAHGEENSSFQRRSYWMLDPAYDNIVLVHYRDIGESRYAGSSSSSQEIVSSTSSPSTNPLESYDLCSFSPDIEISNEITGIPSMPSQTEIHKILRKIEQDLNADDGDEALHQHMAPIPRASEYADDGFVTPDSIVSPSLEARNACLEDVHATPFFSWDGKDNNDVESSIDRDAFFYSPPPKQLFSIREISPEWAFSSEETTKVVIVVDFPLPGYSEINWNLVFGDVQVPAETVQDGVLRCLAPPHIPGKVNVWLTDGNGEARSDAREFEYLPKPESSSSLRRELEVASEGKSKEELLLLTRLTRTLLCASDGQWDHVIESLSGGSGDASGVVIWLLEELLKNELTRRLRPNSGSPECSLSREEKSIVHMVSGLGFLWALNPVLEAGVGVNFRDSSGWTALHWAAHFGREDMVSALIAAGASAGAVTDPTAQDPTGKTPASIADANGHKGLAGYLSEIALNEHLFSLTLQESEIPKGPAEVALEVSLEKIAEENPWFHESATTEDQISLKYTLAAVRGASQAAARIQAAFRAASFRKKQQKADLALEEGYLPLAELHELPRAATRIQKRYRGWRERRNFLDLRQHALRIQAHVRGYQARKRYKEMLWTVGVYEKAVLRWRRRGSGLRGFKVEAAPIEEEEDEEDILKVFRKEKVTTALDVAVTRVLSMVDSHDARHQYRRMVERYWLAKLSGEFGTMASSDPAVEDWIFQDV